MKEIPLTKGKVALVDDEDYERLSKRKWCLTRMRYAGRFGLFMHREIMNAGKGVQVDHIDGDTLNNQKFNLRLCSSRQNSMNQKIRTDNKSGFRGVFFDKCRNKWCAQICINGKSTHLGRFKSAIDAAMKWNQAASLHFGEFAKLNKV